MVDHAIIRDWQGLMTEVMHNATTTLAGIHGVRHWQRVAWTGFQLLAEVPSASPAVVFLFALFHDSMRMSDDHDPDHGRRGAVFARECHLRHHYLRDVEMDLLQIACEKHEKGEVSTDPTLGVCWDSDRLNLWRVHIRPDPKWLSTGAAKNPSRIVWANELQKERFDWTDIVNSYSIQYPHILVSANYQ